MASLALGFSSLSSAANSSMRILMQPAIGIATMAPISPNI